MSANWKECGGVLLLGGLVSALWGCADFETEREALCARHPEACDLSAEGRGPAVTQSAQSSESIPVEGNITFSVDVAEGPSPVEFTWTSAQGSFEKTASDGPRSIATWIPPVCPPVGTSSTVSVVVTRDGASTTKTFSVQAGTCPVTMVSAKGNYTLALRKDGTVWAWGENGAGQLGDGMSFSREKPFQVEGLSDVVFISAGTQHSLAVKRDGSVWAWGANEFGQLGDGSVEERRRPVLVQGLSDVVSVAAGSDLNCGGISLFRSSGYSVALKRDGSVWSWGSNCAGQLGNGTTVASRLPVQVLGLEGMTAVMVGAGSSYSLRNNGTVWSWGLNKDGQLGNGTNLNGLIPTQVPDLAEVRALAVGESPPGRGRVFPRAHVLALRGDGSVWVWGANQYGQLGDGATADRSVPVAVPSLAGIKAIAAGSYHSLAVSEDGVVWGWGWNESGRVGDGTSTHRSSPVRVSNSEGTVALAAGSSHSVSLRKDGAVWTWGYGGSGQLGNGSNRFKASPVAVVGLSSIISIAAGESRSMAIGEDGRVWTWGKALAASPPSTPLPNLPPAPVPISGLSDAISIALGSTHAMVSTRSGVTWTWGGNESGQLGDGTTASRSEPGMIPFNASVYSYAATVEARSSRSVALKSEGTVWEWGAGQNTPTQVAGLSNIIKVAAGDDHSLALKRDGTVWAWGNNTSGQLGDGTTTSQPTPVQVSGLSGIVDVVGVNSRSFAVGSDGSFWAWGNNASGLFGDGSTLSSSSPVRVPGLTEVVSAAASRGHSLVLRKDGTVWAWGFNESGQLGNGTQIDKFKPAQVMGLSHVVAISTRGRHCLALLADGTVRAWGLDQSSELGDGLSFFSFTPVRAVLP